MRSFSTNSGNKGDSNNIKEGSFGNRMTSGDKEKSDRSDNFVDFADREDKNNDKLHENHENKTS